MRQFLLVIVCAVSLFVGSLQAADSFSSEMPSSFVVADASVGDSCIFGTVGLSADKDFLSCVSGRWVQSSSLIVPGTHCGLTYALRRYESSRMASTCKGFNPRYSCPSGYNRVSYYDLGVEQGGKPVDREAMPLADYYTCFKQ